MDNFLHVVSLSKHRISLFTLFLCLSFSAHASSWQSSDYILASFNKIALGNSPLKKWHKPIYYQLVHHIDDIELHEKLVKLHFDQLQNITGLDIHPADSSHKANMTIVLTTESKLQADVGYFFKLKDVKQISDLTKNKIGVTSIRSNSEGYIEQSVVVIPTDRARAYGRLLTSFAEMLTRGIGMQHHNNSVSPSIFNGRSVDSVMTGLDCVMIKLLYDKRMKPSMGNKELGKLGKSILSEKNYQKFVKEADLIVRRSGLNSLLN